MMKKALFLLAATLVSNASFAKDYNLCGKVESLESYTASSAGLLNTTLVIKLFEFEKPIRESFSSVEVALLLDAKRDERQVCINKSGEGSKVTTRIVSSK